MASLEMSGSQVNIVILDAGRENPLPETSARNLQRAGANL